MAPSTTPRQKSAAAGLTDAGPGLSTAQLSQEASRLAERMPDLIMEADRIAATVAHGIHGRRRAGPGETFWQFRTYEAGEGAHLVDWRRSASSSHHLYVREREWEAAHTLYLWPNLSPSMAFKSHLSPVRKSERAFVLTLACAQLFVRSGERVAFLGLTQPTASRHAAQKFAEAVLLSPNVSQTSEPPTGRLARFSTAILFSDFLEPIDKIRATIESLGAAGANGHLVQILDPAEETLPYTGRTEFTSIDGGHRWIAERAENLRRGYRDRLLAHRAAIQDIAHRLGWSFLVHHTDRPASEALMSLQVRLDGSATRGLATVTTGVESNADASATDRATETAQEGQS